MDTRTDEDNEELAALLAGFTEPAEREEIMRAYYALTTGDRETFPAQFALVVKAQLKAALAVPKRIQDQLQRSNTISERAASRIEEAGSKIVVPVERVLIDLQTVKGIIQQSQTKTVSSLGEALNRRLDPIADQLNAFEPAVRSYLGKIEQTARRARQIQATALLTALLVAFLLGAVIGAAFIQFVRL